jgi:AraC-like DNA-binding protein
VQFQWSSWLAPLASVRGSSAARFWRNGSVPAKAMEQLRVEPARLMMEQGRHSMDDVARETGFAGRERMRRAFIRAFGQPPQAIRRNARLGESTGVPVQRPHRC